MFCICKSINDLVALYLTACAITCTVYLPLKKYWVTKVTTWVKVRFRGRFRVRRVGHNQTLSDFLTLCKFTWGLEYLFFQKKYFTRLVQL